MGGSVPHGRASASAEMTLTPGPDFRRFILDNTAILSPPHVPEVRLHLADEAHDLWHKTEDELQQSGLQPPFWAFAWAGGQGLARHVLDHPEWVRGKSVVDFATGSGLVAIAAELAGAKSVLAADIDVFCADAVKLNAIINKADLQFTSADLLGSSIDAEVLLAGDVFYHRDMAANVTEWFDRLAEQGVTILVGDPGRAYLPREKLTQLSEHQVKVTRALEDADVRKTTVWQFTG
ncbi:MAG: class I SAM-dependent methyltransferase [Rhizobiaceae bacterium]